MHPFIDVLLAATERPDKDGQSLADRLHDSFSAKWETYDGTLVNELMTMIDVVVERTPAEEVRAAYSLLAEQHWGRLVGRGRRVQWSVLRYVRGRGAGCDKGEASLTVAAPTRQRFGFAELQRMSSWRRPFFPGCLTGRHSTPLIGTSPCVSLPRCR